MSCGVVHSGVDALRGACVVVVVDEAERVVWRAPVACGAGDVVHGAAAAVGVAPAGVAAAF
jgi:hypothetical protein